jgi:hypothetical protein
MQHWTEQLPGYILPIDYADLVLHPGVTGKKMADFCHLKWDDRALEIGESRVASLTASAAQIRADIYRSSVSQWRRYEDALAPLARRLAALGVIIPD